MYIFGNYEYINHLYSSNIYVHKISYRTRKYDLPVLAKVRTHIFEFFMYIKLYIFDELYTRHLHSIIDSIFVTFCGRLTNRLL